MHKYHGPKRELDLLKLLDFDVILTTYATVAAEFRRCSNILHSINWFRIVLDEGRFGDLLLSTPNILVAYWNTDIKHYSPCNPPPKYWTIPCCFNIVVQDSMVFEWDTDPEFPCRPGSTCQISPCSLIGNSSSISELHHITD
jgi:hypothetical protein